jgi:hypothetical protein
VLGEWIPLLEEGNPTGQDENETGTLRVLMWVLLPLEAISNGETQSKHRNMVETGEGVINIRPLVANLTLRIVEGVPTGQEEIENGTTRVQLANRFLVVEEQVVPCWSNRLDETGTIAVETSRMGGAHQTSLLACLQEQSCLRRLTWNAHLWATCRLLMKATTRRNESEGNRP